MSAGARPLYSRAVLRRVWAGLAIVGCATAVLSFDALADLGRMIGMTGRVEIGPARFYLAWLLPLSIDVFAIVATYIWLRRIGTESTVAYAMHCALSAIASTILGNGYHGYIVATSDPIPWGATVAIYSVPPIALAGLVHLGMLVGRDVEAALDELPPGAARPDDPEWLRAYRLGLDDALAVEWTVAIRAWRPDEQPAGGTGGDVDEPGGWHPPDRGESNDCLAADLRAVDSARRAADLAPLPRDAIVERYGVGKGRASRLRELADRAGSGGDVDELPPAAPTGAPGRGSEGDQGDRRGGDELLDGEPVESVGRARAAAGGGGRT